MGGAAGRAEAACGGSAGNGFALLVTVNDARCTFALGGRAGDEVGLLLAAVPRKAASLASLAARSASALARCSRSRCRRCCFHAGSDGDEEEAVEGAVSSAARAGVCSLATVESGVVTGRAARPPMCAPRDRPTCGNGRLRGFFGAGFGGPSSSLLLGAGLARRGDRAGDDAAALAGVSGARTGAGAAATSASALAGGVGSADGGESNGSVAGDWYIVNIG